MEPIARTPILHNLLILVVGALALPAAAVAEGDESATKTTLTIPAEHAALGQVYYVVDTKKPQVTFRSNTKAEKFQGNSTQISGYIVAPTEGEQLPVQFGAGEFRLPVFTLKTRNPSMNNHMHGTRWLNADSFPHIVFTLTGVTDEKLIKERETSTLYVATLNGTMSIMEQEKELSVKAKITFKPESDKTRRTAPGDLMIIKCKFDVTLADFGIGIGDEAIKKGRIAEKIRIDTSLTLSTVQPTS